MVTSADNSIVHKDERNCIDSINEDILNWVKEKSIVGMSYIHSEGPKDLIIRSSFKTCLAMNLVPGIWMNVNSNDDKYHHVVPGTGTTSIGNQPATRITRRSTVAS